MIEKMPPPNAESIQLGLKDVPETMLWPLWNRASEQSHPQRVLDDPMSAELTRRIDYDFRANFGKASVFHAVRARVIDDKIKAWLGSNSQGTVIALGEGLETQCWRVDNGTLNWISVDLPESVEAQRKLLPIKKRMRRVPCSALDPKWMEGIETDKPVFITAAGLLMYFQESDGKRLLKMIAEHFDSGAIVFDMIPKWFSKKTLTGNYKITPQYTAPRMPWGLDFDQHYTLESIHPKLRLLASATYIDGFSHRARVYAFLCKLPPIRKRMPGIVHMSFR